MAIMSIGGNASAVPSDSTIYSEVGDIVWNNTPSMGAPTGWQCSVAGYPGTWIALAPYGGGSELTTTATSGTLSSSYSMILLNPASTGTYSLPNVTAYASGSSLFIKNIASGSTTLTPLAANGYEAAAITLAQYAAITLRSAGTTNWYKQA